jgi:hypothetical protein
MVKTAWAGGPATNCTGKPEHVGGAAVVVVVVVVATQSVNAFTEVPPVDAGTTDPIVVTATKTNPNLPAIIEIRSTNTDALDQYCNVTF